jgi:hypothetical protein
MDEILYLPVSIGEAIDKLTILDIKLEFITDEFRKSEVKKEYDMLYDKLQDFIIKYEEFYKIMKNVNRNIWFMMDILRDSKNISDEEYYKKCKECIDANDVRFRIKNKINNITKSSLKEQKSYNILRCILDIKENNFNIDEKIGIVKYYSYLYDEVIVLNNNDDKSEINLFKLKFDNYDIFNIKIEDSYNLLLYTKFIKLSDYTKINEIINELIFINILE